MISGVTVPSGAQGLHALLNYFGINFRFDYTLTPLIVLGISFKSVITALWDYTCTPEITLTLLNCFQINFQNITLTLTLTLLLVTPAQHINFGHSHFPQKIPQNAENGVPKMNFPELPGPRVSVEILQKT